MNAIYYTEVNLICIVILFLIKRQFHNKSEEFSAEMVVFNQLIWATMILCFFDMISGSCRGAMFPGALIVLHASNLIFFVALSVISYLWMIYVNIRLKTKEDISERTKIIWGIPLVVFTLLAATNPWSKLFFSFNELNVYKRSDGVILHWIITWLYLFIPTVQTIRVFVMEKNKFKRQEIVPLLYFVIPPFFASMVQMFFYGVTSAQVGATLSIVIIFLFMQQNQIVTDALTGLNNRHGFNKYLQNVLMDTKTDITIFMLDLNSFKQINDKFGHMIGDRALQGMAESLVEACKVIDNKLFLCRYGGDEFIIVIHDCTAQDAVRLQKQIDKELDLKNKATDIGYTLSTSIGLASGICNGIKDVEFLMKEADNSMYTSKKEARYLVS